MRCLSLLLPCGLAVAVGLQELALDVFLALLKLFFRRIGRYILQELIEPRINLFEIAHVCFFLPC
jgi:hypothetical protein